MTVEELIKELRAVEDYSLEVIVHHGGIISKVTNIQTLEATETDKAVVMLEGAFIKAD